MNSGSFIVQKRPHESGAKHVSGYANYIDDIVEPEGTLYGAIGYSKKAHAIIKKLDLKEVWKSEGVVSVVTSEDISGRNDVGAVHDGDPIFPKKAEYFGQPLYAVAATSTELARKAVLKAKISYKSLKVINNIQEALKKKSFVLKENKVKNEYYVSEIYNMLLKLNTKFEIDIAEEFTPLGTPNDLKKFEM